MVTFGPPIIDTAVGSNGSVNGRVAQDGGTWTAPGFAGEEVLSIVTNAFGRQVSYGNAYLSSQYGPDMQIAIRIGVPALAGAAVHIYARVNETNMSSGTADYYAIDANSVTGATSNDTLKVRRRLNGAYTTLTPATGSETGWDWAADHWFGADLAESSGVTLITTYRKTSTAGAWTQVCTYTDATAGRAVLAGGTGTEVGDATARLTNLSAMTVVPRYPGITFQNPGVLCKRTGLWLPRRDRIFVPRRPKLALA